ncbi:MAG: hypothetical protein K2L88_05300, partial [Clostridiales bacterium]|nr:hypothetical protein [Clostridiales bacterium]
MEYSMNESALKAYEIARKTAKYYSNEYTGTEHLLYGILKVECYASKIFAANGFDPDRLIQIFEDESNKPALAEPVDSDRVRQSIPFTAYSISTQLGAAQISPDHIMLAILEDRNCLASEALYRIYNVNVAAYRRSILKILQNSQPKTDNPLFSSGVFGVPGFGSDFFSGSSGASDGVKTNSHALPAQLADLGVDVTAKARQNKLDPVIGREQEVSRLIEILCRKTKNNPVLIGEPGVGKSAIIDGLAKAIVECKEPRQRQNN